MNILFYVCPYLEQKVYFGVNFWQAFGLAPAVIGHGDAEIVKKAYEVHARGMEHYPEQEDDVEDKPCPESWELSEADARQLKEIQEAFLTFEKDGLGTTSLEKHTIELIEGGKVFEDHPYPMSPAKQRVVEDEVDKMLAVGVIEESNSP